MKILSQNGFENFDGFIYQGIKPVFKLELSNNKIIEATEDHKFLMIDNSFKELRELKINDKFSTGITIKNIINENKEIPVYDALNVSNGNVFWADSIIVHNCSMLYIDECITKENIITVRNKKTGKIEQLPIEKFYNGLK